MRRQIDRLLEGAEEALLHRDWVQVQNHAKDLLALQPENQYSLALLAAAERSWAESDESASFLSPARSAPSITDHGDQPTSFASGRYQVKRFLGEGGKKKVYLAQDTQLDREVAFALIETEGLDEVSRTRITREARRLVGLAPTRTSSPCSILVKRRTSPTW